jgi:hypothetical protein
LAPLEKAKHAWVDELPSVLLSLRTTPNAATQETPFFLVHGVEAVLPVEITHEALLLGDGARKELWRLVDVGAVSPCAW